MSYISPSLTSCTTPFCSSTLLYLPYQNGPNSLSPLIYHARLNSSIEKCLLIFSTPILTKVCRFVAKTFILHMQNGEDELCKGDMRGSWEMPQRLQCWGETQFTSGCKFCPTSRLLMHAQKRKQQCWHYPYVQDTRYIF